MAASPLHVLACQVRRVPYLRGGMRRLRLLPRAVRLAAGPAASARYWEEAPQKSTLRMAAENLLWTLRHGSVNRSYFLHGLDGTDAPPSPPPLYSHDYRMAQITEQVQAREVGSLVALLKDKYLFALVAEALGHPSPRNRALLGPDGVTLLDPRRETTYERLAEELERLNGFCKPMRGQHGEGSFPLDVREGQLFVNGNATPPAALRARVAGRSLLQERVEQHAEMAAIYPHALNTVRLITAHDGEEVRPFVAVLRVGGGGSIVDNWSAGGLVVLIDRETDQLQGRGFYKPGTHPPGARERTAVQHHPDTGVRFEGYPLPHFEEAAALACRFHRDLGDLLTIAWDLAITPDGPVVVEGNTHWDGAIYLALDPSFEGRYRRLIERA